MAQAASSPGMAREALSMRAVAELLDVHYETVRRAVARGELEAFRVGRVLRIRRDVVRTYVLKRRS